MPYIFAGGESPASTSLALKARQMLLCRDYWMHNIQNQGPYSPLVLDFPDHLCADRSTLGGPLGSLQCGLFSGREECDGLPARVVAWEGDDAMRLVLYLFGLRERRSFLVSGKLWFWARDDLLMHSRNPGVMVRVCGPRATEGWACSG